LYDFGDYPGAVLDATASSQTHGTVFELPDDDSVLSALDAYEDFHPDNVESSLFVRTLQPVTLVNGDLVQCWIYVYNREPGGARPIPSGRYAGIKKTRE
jgi:gamma-glutamylcyclotransferase (GGCT)/AIG2-like uncharacterized protein YtfP